MIRHFVRPMLNRITKHDREPANTCRIYQTLGTTPAMNAGIAQYPMTMEDLIEMLCRCRWRKSAGCTKSGLLE
ncbi:MAG TPA: hypothetical protein VHZ24_19045 [Pirellulales bacterium]|jgi:hypothetical protein|nr:hypothetical protein [Pirellulales bacterium]